MSSTITFLQSCKLSDEIHSEEGCNGNQMIKLTLNDYNKDYNPVSVPMCKCYSHTHSHNQTCNMYIFATHCLWLSCMTCILVHEIQEQLL